MIQRIKSWINIKGTSIKSFFERDSNIQMENKHMPSQMSEVSESTIKNNPSPDNLNREYFELCHIEAITSPFKTNTIFDEKHHDDDLSPIDLFIKNTAQLHILKISENDHVLSNLLLLGYVSAAESYLRSLIRRLVSCDEYIQSIVAEKNVSYAAAFHHKKELLPEALLEDFSFANPYNIFETLKDLIGMKGARPAAMMSPSNEFRKICELRHCCVHRFGKLGSKNAVRLGLDDHHKFLEKPLKLSSQHMEEIAFIVDNFVKSVNNVVYKYVMDRTAKNKNGEANGEKIYKSDWSWDFESDAERFQKYYSIFATTLDTIPSISLDDAYRLFKDENKPSLPVRRKDKTP